MILSTIYIYIHVIYLYFTWQLWFTIGQLESGVMDLILIPSWDNTNKWKVKQKTSKLYTKFINVRVISTSLSWVFTIYWKLNKEEYKMISYLSLYKTDSPLVFSITLLNLVFLFSEIRAT